MNPQTILGQAAQAMNAGAPALSQVSAQAPTYNPGLQTPPATPMPNKSPATEINGGALQRAMQRRGMQAPTSQPTSQGGEVTLPVNDANSNQPGVQVPVSEAELIIKALTKRMDMLGKHESAVRDHLFPSVNQTQ